MKQSKRPEATDTDRQAGSLEKERYERLTQFSLRRSKRSDEKAVLL